MAFQLAYWGRTNSTLNYGHTVNYTNGVGTVEGCNALFTYNGLSASDPIATIAAVDYFVPVINDLSLNDVIVISADDPANGMYVVSAITYPDSNGIGATVTLASFAGGASVATANIQNNAVTYAKIQEAAASRLIGNPTGGTTEVSEVSLAAPLSFSGTSLTIANAAIAYAKLQNEATVTLLGNPTGAPAAPSEITLGAGLGFNGTTLRVLPSNLVYVTGTISAAEWNGMYVAPKLLAAAGGANTAYSVADFTLELVYGAAQFANGGAILVQYDSTANGAGTPATSTLAAATINGLSADSLVTMPGALSAAGTATTVNKGLYISNQTGAFTTGDSTFRFHLWARLIATDA